MNISTGIIVLISCIPTLCWFMFYYRMDKNNPEPIGLLLQTFLYGLVGALLLIALQYLSLNNSGISIAERLEAKNVSDVGITFLLAWLEEMIKGVLLFWILLRKRKMLNQYLDGVIFGVSLALGFALLENIVYFIQVMHLITRFDFIVTYLFRTLGTMFAHTLFTGIVGYFIVYGILDVNTTKLIIKKEGEIYFALKDFIREILTMHILFHHILGGYPSDKGHFLFGIFFESIFLSTVLHFIFNLLLSTNLYDKNIMFLSIPFLFFVACFVFKIFKDKQALQVRNSL